MKPFVLSALLLAGVTAQPLPLPQQRDIPDNFSTKLCPDRAAAERLLSDFYASNDPANNLIDIPLFMRGLAETGCEQLSGPIEIQEVIARRTLDLGWSVETHIAYRGVRPDGSVVWGVVDETWNDRLPRTPLEAFVQQLTDGGWLPSAAEWAADATQILVCPGPAEARAVIAAMPDPLNSSESSQRRGFERARRANRCAPAPANGRYRVTAVFETNSVGCGYECGTSWTAVAAETPAGLSVGLLHGFDEW
jgi:hypothetical protein